MFVYLLVMPWILSLLLPAAAGAAEIEDVEDLCLSNARIAVTIHGRTGAIRRIDDREQELSYQFDSIGFAVTTDRGRLTSEKCVSKRTGDGSAIMTFDFPEFSVDLHYELPADAGFVEKWIVITSKRPGEYFLEQVVLEEARTSVFHEIRFHDDNTIWHCPVNLFLRAEKGGCFAGLEYPYWDWQVDGNRGFRLGYKPNYRVGAGETNTSEKYFLGVFRKEGIQRFSQGPYPGKVKADFLNWVGTGLSQHFPESKIPPQAVTPEVLDWGEVWAMQDFMRHVLPDLPLPEEGYWVWQNGWWAGLFKLDTAQLDRLKEAGIHDVMTAHTWYGQGNHPMEEPYLTNMRIDPPGFPLPEGPPSLTGQVDSANREFHAQVRNIGREYANPKEFEPEFRAPEIFENYVRYARSIGVHVNSFALPGIYFRQRPEWASIDKAGNPSTYIFGRRTSCPASDDYMSFLLYLHDQVFRKYRPRWWGWDGRWLSYWDVALSRPGGKGVGPDPCYAKNHGHLPGDNYYKEWKNIEKFLAELRRRFPNMCLEQYLGLKRGGPWALRYLNCDDNYYETSGADMNRFQAWHNQNDRFRPVYKNYAAVFGETQRDFRLNVIAALSATAHCQIGPGFKALALAENRNFLTKWREWASRNLVFLKVKRDLFGCPGYSRVDGSAHIIKDRGFIFLFPGGIGAPDHALRARALSLPETTRASIPLNRWVGLANNTKARFRITEVYPTEGRELGIYKYGQDFLYDMPRDSAVILSLEPAEPAEEAEAPALARQAVVVHAF